MLVHEWSLLKCVFTSRHRYACARMVVTQVCPHHQASLCLAGMVVTQVCPHQWASLCLCMNGRYSSVSSPVGIVMLVHEWSLLKCALTSRHRYARDRLISSYLQSSVLSGYLYGINKFISTRHDTKLIQFTLECITKIERNCMT